jgi:hypothetical protein
VIRLRVAAFCSSSRRSVLACSPSHSLSGAAGLSGLVPPSQLAAHPQQEPTHQLPDPSPPQPAVQTKPQKPIIVWLPSLCSLCFVMSERIRAPSVCIPDSRLLVVATGWSVLCLSAPSLTLSPLPPSFGATDLLPARLCKASSQQQVHQVSLL